MREVSPDAESKDRYVVVDAVGVCEGAKTESVPMERKPHVSSLQILFSRPRKTRLEMSHLRELAEPPRSTNYVSLWTAHAMLQKRPRKMATARLLLTDLIPLVRFAAGEDDELSPFAEQAERRFGKWLVAQKAAGREFSEAQLGWLYAIRDHIVAELSVSPEDFDLSPFAQKGGLGGAYAAFGEDLNAIIAELNEELAA